MYDVWQPPLSFRTTPLSSHMPSLLSSTLPSLQPPHLPSLMLSLLPSPLPSFPQSVYKGPVYFIFYLSFSSAATSRWSLTIVCSPCHYFAWWRLLFQKKFAYRPCSVKCSTCSLSSNLASPYSSDQRAFPLHCVEWKLDLSKFCSKILTFANFGSQLNTSCVQLFWNQFLKQELLVGF